MRNLLLATILGALIGGCATTARINETPAILSKAPEGSTKDEPGPSPKVLDEARPLADDIRTLISELQDISVGGAGMSSTYNAFAFAPLPEISYNTGALILGREPSGVSEAFRRLVELGPVALPYLLEALDDDRPTRATTGGRMMWSSLDTEVYGVGANERECKIIEKTKLNSKRVADEVYLETSDFFEMKYRLLVGDVCFTIIGQITNRPYSASRYQPTAGLVINSPVHNPLIADIVRALWAVPNPTETLHENLLIDLETKDWFGRYSGAATRLLYYFGDQDSDTIVTRMKAEALAKHPATGEMVMAVSFSDNKKIVAECLDIFRNSTESETTAACLPVVLRHDPDLYVRLLTAAQEEENDPVVVEELAQTPRRQELLDAAMHAKDPAIRKAMAALVPGARDARELFACLPAGAELAHDETVARLLELLDKYSGDTRPEEDAFGLVYGAALYLPDDVGDVIREYGSYTGAHEAIRQANLALVIGKTEVSGWQDLLLPLLSVESDSFYGMFDARTDRDGYQLAYRVCDLAAWAATQRDSNLTFKVEGDYDTLDAQIKVIRKALRE